jgi:hypothetical protein
MMQMQLGMIPSWQFSADPGVNIKINPHVQFPPGWDQRTVQPIGPAYTANLGRSVVDCVCDSGREWCCGGRTSAASSWFTTRRGLRGAGDFLFENRKAIVLGGLGLLAAAGLGITAAFLK